jgi:hypothetical protein
LVCTLFCTHFIWREISESRRAGLGAGHPVLERQPRDVRTGSDADKNTGFPRA